MVKSVLYEFREDRIATFKVACMDDQMYGPEGSENGAIQAGNIQEGQKAIQADFTILTEGEHDKFITVRLSRS